MEATPQGEKPQDSLQNQEDSKLQQGSDLYQKTLPQVPPIFSELLEHYSGIPPSEQTAHITILRDRAYETHHYPCLGLFRFTNLSLASHPLYKSYVLPTLLAPPSEDTEPVFLDLGTCLGQDIRKLIFDGVSASRIWGADLLPEFIDLGFQLFRDRDKIAPGHFLAPADVFDTSSSNTLAALDGKVTILQTNSVFHLFNYDDQLALAKRAIKLLRPGTGADRLILGSHNGNVVPAEYPSRNRHRTKTIFRHNKKSWAEFWDRVSQELGGAVTFRVESRLMEPRMPEGVKVVDTWRGQGYMWMVWHVWVKFN